MVFALPSCPNFPQCLLYCDWKPIECFYSLRIKAQSVFSQWKKGNQSTQQVPFACRIISPARHVTVFMVPSFVLILECFHITGEQCHSLTRILLDTLAAINIQKAFKFFFFLFVRKNTFLRQGLPQSRMASDSFMTLHLLPLPPGAEITGMSYHNVLMWWLGLNPRLCKPSANLGPFSILFFQPGLEILLSQLPWLPFRV